MSESTKKHKAAAPKKLNFAIFVCSTSRYQQLQRGEKIDDVSGDTIEFLLKNAGHVVLFKEIISDDRVMIQDAVKRARLNPDLERAVAERLVLALTRRGAVRRASDTSEP